MRPAELARRIASGEKWRLVPDHAECDALLSELDAIARDVCGHEYGLPMFDDGHRARMRAAIYRWAVGQAPPNAEGTK